MSLYCGQTADFSLGIAPKLDNFVVITLPFDAISSKRLSGDCNELITDDKLTSSTTCSLQFVQLQARCGFGFGFGLLH